MMEGWTSIKCQKGAFASVRNCIEMIFADSKNKFVYYALKYTLILASERLSSMGSSRSLRDSLQHGLDIATVGDNDFYSQQAKVIGTLRISALVY
jgi:hypothetical protein